VKARQSSVGPWPQKEHRSVLVIGVRLHCGLRTSEGHGDPGADRTNVAARRPLRISGRTSLCGILLSCIVRQFAVSIPDPMRDQSPCFSEGLLAEGASIGQLFGPLR